MTREAIEIIQLGMIYKGKKGRLVNALSDMSLTIERGEVFGFLGPNGAGKSTTIKSLVNLITPTAGEARIFGVPVSKPSARANVGYLPENPAFYDFLTAEEYLQFVGASFGMDPSSLRRESERVLERMELQDAAGRPIRGYSKGMVQRLGIAQALLHDPDLYILDEPMSGLDPMGRALVKDIIKELRQKGKTVFFSTHITADVEIVCDRVGVIVQGQLRAVDRVEHILERGIEGYFIQLAHADSATEELYVEKDRLKAFLEETTRTDAAIERIEPKRKDLEAFFLDIVAASGHEK